MDRGSMSLRRFARHVVEKFEVDYARSWLLDYERSHTCPMPPQRYPAATNTVETMIWWVYFAEDPDPPWDKLRSIYLTELRGHAQTAGIAPRYIREIPLV